MDQAGQRHMKKSGSGSHKGTMSGAGMKRGKGTMGSGSAGQGKPKGAMGKHQSTGSGA